MENWGPGCQGAFGVKAPSGAGWGGHVFYLIKNKNGATQKGVIMLSQVKFGTRFLTATLLLIPALGCTIFGMMPYSFWVGLFGGSDEAVQSAGAYFYWKNCLSTGSCLIPLVLLGALNSRFFKTGTLMIAGLVFSMIGDFFMKQSNLIGGIGFFGLGHICFMLFFFLNGRMSWASLAALVILLAAYLPYFFTALVPAIRPAPNGTILIGAVAFYLAVSVLSFSATLSFGSKWWLRILAALGIGCILFSDTLIAENMFCHRDKLYFLMMPTYLATHFLIAAAAVYNFVLYKTEAE